MSLERIEARDRAKASGDVRNNPITEALIDAAFRRGVETGKRSFQCRCGVDDLLAQRKLEEAQ